MDKNTKQKKKTTYTYTVQAKPTEQQSHTIIHQIRTTAHIDLYTTDGIIKTNTNTCKEKLLPLYTIAHKKIGSITLKQQLFCRKPLFRQK